MNNPNPFVPKGSILEQQSQRRSRLKLAVFCVLAVAVAGLATLLIEGCKRTPSPEADNSTPNIDTNPPAITDTNPPPIIDTNPPVLPTNPPAYIPPPAPPATTEYTVVEHDTFGKISKKFGVTVKALEAANPGVVPTKLKIGQKLSIPAGGSVSPSSSDTGAAVSGGEVVYVVKSGDNLTRIAHAHGTTVRAIKSENGLTTDHIKVGQKLKIPAKAEPAAPAVAAPEPVTPVATPAAEPTNPPAAVPGH